MARKTKDAPFTVTERATLYVSPKEGESPIAWLTRLTHQLGDLAGQFSVGLHFDHLDTVREDLLDEDDGVYNSYEDESMRFELVAERPMTPAERTKEQARRDKAAAAAKARAEKQAKARLAADRKAIAEIKKRNPELLADA